MKLAIVIAAYNEENSIHSTLSSLPKKLDGINCIVPIVVDDGSTDRTGELAEEAGAQVLTHLINRGQGAALKTGFDYAVKYGYDLVVTFDADGQHQSEDIPALIRPIVDGKVEVTLGSRFKGKKAINMSYSRKIVLLIGVIFTRLISRISVTDTHNGLRAFSRKALQTIELMQDKMEHASEILDQISRHKLSFMEVPVTIKYSDYSLQKGQRSSQALKIALTILFYKMVR
ncbi:glycosyltransferase family 2 protein [Patescibacteria group bacterium]|nr:glycosyltransferase family 2 protein [Patescibacteria group bacterium]